MAKIRKRYFAEEFKREAAQFWDTSGRLETDVARELGIMPTMLRHWQRKLQSGRRGGSGNEPASIDHGLASGPSVQDGQTTTGTRAQPHGARHPKRSGRHRGNYRPANYTIK